MSALKSVYEHQLGQLRDMSGQIESVSAKLADTVLDDDLSKRLRKTKDRIALHSVFLESLLSDVANGENVARRVPVAYGLSRSIRANKSTGDGSAFSRGRQVCRSALGAFATAKAIAEALGDDRAARKLGEALGDIHDLDGLMAKMTAGRHPAEMAG